MRLRNITGSRDIIAESDLVIHDETKQKGKWKDVFGNDLPIRLEIGMGKGRFIMDMAEKYPEADYLGIEKYSSVLLRAIQKMEERTEQGESLNVRFIRMDAEYICDVFEEGEVDRIYLNFSDPWPKDRHAKRRLESRQFLERYDRILKKDGRIEFKTDNRALFEFAVEEVEASAFKITALSYDLHSDKDMMQGNVMTEYEEKFSSIGNPICKYILERR